MGILRAALGLLSLFFAHYLGRSAAGLYRGTESRARTIAWSLRTAVAIGAILWSGGLDILGVAVLALAAVAAAAGARIRLRRAKSEEDQADLSR